MGAAQLARHCGPRTDQNPWKEPTMTTTMSALPTRADLDAATARTAAATEHGTPAEVQRAAEAEEAAHYAYLQRPGADTELQAEAELEAGG